MIYNKIFDRLGVTSSCLCMCHCIGTLILLFILPLSGLAFFTGEMLHQFFGLFTLASAMLAFGFGYKKHGNAFLPLFALIGIILLATPIFAPEEYITLHLEVLLTLCGATILIFLHWRNQFLCNQCREGCCSN